ncbi:hypothetical protein [Streptomyces diastaticus]|uniref:hypothetical protein n=1 Tax=Streptomyces diastaticus TaxID=1956 RepID=UPI0035E0B8C7
MTASIETWHKSACILCENNCGIQIQTEGRRFATIRGDKDHVATAGYTCTKALRLDHYQNGGARLTTRLRREPDGTFTPIDWDTVVPEIAARLKTVRDTRGGESRRAGQPPRRRLQRRPAGRPRRPLPLQPPLAQEKTGEGHVDAHLTGGHPWRLHPRRGLALPRQEPLAVARRPARPHRAQGHRQGPRPHDDRRGPGPHRDGRSRRHPRPGEVGHRRLVPGRPPSASWSKRTSSTTSSSPPAPPEPTPSSPSSRRWSSPPARGPAVWTGICCAGRPASSPPPPASRRTRTWASSRVPTARWCPTSTS